MMAFLSAGMPSGRRISDFAGMQQRRAVDDGVDGRLALRLAAAQVNDRLALFPEQRGGLVQLQSHRLFDGSSELT